MKQKLREKTDKEYCIMSNCAIVGINWGDEGTP